jgi:outer membrane protein
MTEETDNLNENKADDNVRPLATNSIPLEETENIRERPRPSHSLLVVLNIALLIGLIVLYFLFFSEKGKDSGAGMVNALAKANKGSISVAFVNNDSIFAHYDLVKKLRSEFDAKTERLSGEVAAKQKAFEKDAAYFQEQVQKKALSEQSSQEIYSSLQENQQKINDLRDQYSSELQKDEMDMQVVLLDSVMNFIKRYNTRYKFDYILGFNKVGSILYANDTLDITKDVIKELNNEYQAKNLSK